MEKAAQVWATLPRESAGIDAIARAIAEERERCAQWARNNLRIEFVDGQDEKIIGRQIDIHNDSVRKIIHGINSGEKPWSANSTLTL